MTRCTRVSIWEAPDSKIWHPEPASVAIGDDYATVKVSRRSWPQGLDTDDVLPGWQVMAHKTTDPDGDLELAYEGEVVEVESTGTMYKLQCEPATKPSQNFVAPTAQPNPQLPQPQGKP